MVNNGILEYISVSVYPNCTQTQIGHPKRKTKSLLEQVSGDLFWVRLSMVKQCNIDSQYVLYSVNIVVDLTIDFVCFGHFGLVSIPLGV